MNKLGWVTAAALGALLLAGAAYQKTSADDNREILLRIERQLIIQNHELPYEAKSHFRHRTFGEFCDGGDFCKLVDKSNRSTNDAVLDEIEKLKGKDFRTRFAAWAREESVKGTEKK